MFMLSSSHQRSVRRRVLGMPLYSWLAQEFFHNLDVAVCGCPVQWRHTIGSLCVQVCTVMGKQLDNVQMTLLCCIVQRRPGTVASRVAVCTLFKQNAGDLWMIIFGCKVESGLAPSIPSVYFGAPSLRCADEAGQELLLPGGSSPMQYSPFVPVSCLKVDVFF